LKSENCSFLGSGGHLLKDATFLPKRGVSRIRDIFRVFF